MISRLQGTVIEHDGPIVVVDCGGVGYSVAVCPDEQSLCTSGDVVTLYISENIKEDAHDLYGFMTKSRRSLYQLLLSVNGVGPKSAQSIVCVAGEGAVRKAIAEGDTALLSRANGVGKKAAERVVVDLKNKVGLVASADATDFLTESTLGDNDEAVQALVSLGYSLNDAKATLLDIDSSLTTGERVTLALKGNR
jgi:holliday junction DNA helicase RuvA